jgi:hypothetical protein
VINQCVVRVVGSQGMVLAPFKVDIRHLQGVTTLGKTSINTAFSLTQGKYVEVRYSLCNPIRKVGITKLLLRIWWRGVRRSVRKC